MPVERALRIGVGGPVGSGKSSLIAALCGALAAEARLGVVTNDIYTTEDADFLRATGVLPDERIAAVQTGGCPHTAIRDDISANLEAVAELEAATGPLDVVFVESGGDNLTAIFSPALADVQIFVIDVAGGDDIPRKGGPGIARADLLDHQQDRPRALRRLRRRAHGPRGHRAPRHPPGHRDLTPRKARARWPTGSASNSPPSAPTATCTRASPASRTTNINATLRGLTPSHDYQGKSGARIVKGSDPLTLVVVDRRGVRELRRGARIAPRMLGPGRLTLLRSQAGPLAGDHDRVELRVEAGTLTVVPVAATVALPGAARTVLELDVEVGDGARLVLEDAPLVVAEGRTCCGR